MDRIITCKNINKKEIILIFSKVRQNKKEIFIILLSIFLLKELHFLRKLVNN